MENKRFYHFRRYVVVAVVEGAGRVETLIEGENALESAQKLVEKNKATFAKWGVNGSTWIRRVGGRYHPYIVKQAAIFRNAY